MTLTLIIDQNKKIRLVLFHQPYFALQNWAERIFLDTLLASISPSPDITRWDATDSLHLRKAAMVEMAAIMRMAARFLALARGLS